MEPFRSVRSINKYRRRLRMPMVTHNINGKIWVFTNRGYDVTIVKNTEQQLTVLMLDQNSTFSFYATFVYAKYDSIHRLDIWDDLYQLCGGIDRPWLIGGDFNVVLNGEKKIGGLPVVAIDYEDFKTCMESCDLSQVNFKESPFTWSNDRVEHLARSGSDHAPMLLTCEDRITSKKKPFRFLKFWTEHITFKDVVRLNLDFTTSSNPFLDFKRKIKKVKNALYISSKETFGNIFQ
ncbi:hypothetical protein H5410_003506 [Solanum commersonii]|uniref:Endonuclease/exonuclease/phosphatase domain-containing protein n=1 Tax=Solanum commersonii TaxID=4109 RepID=A0A9J6B4V8_SOLCO|nr:hypothetical protein H5410_003506 [Solanum commersonii]